jgi:peptidoglycan/LPS O-acetylase OafA/YrhL
MIRGAIVRKGKLLSILILAVAAPLEAETQAGPPLGTAAWLGMMVLIVLLVVSIFAYHIVTDPRRRRRGQADGREAGHSGGPSARGASQ